MKTLTGVKTKECRVCGEQKPLSEYHKKHDNKDGLQTCCRTCHYEITRHYRVRGEGRTIYSRTGGPYRVVYCPCDSFTAGSSFTRTEISKMMANEYLAIGTRFKRGIDEWEVSSRMTLLEVMA